MKLTKWVSSICMVALLFLTTEVKALSLTLANSDFHWNSASQPSAADLFTAFGITIGGELWKKNGNDGAESGSLKDSYDGIFSGSGGDGTITIDYITGKPVAVASYLMVKDGNLGAYIWDMSAWNGTDQLLIDDVFPTKDTISHVQFWGRQGNSQNVPEGGASVALMGLALGGIAAGRRFFTKA